jgi:coenzyme PQQ synthesis protein D (PqqD)
VRTTSSGPWPANACHHWFVSKLAPEAIVARRGEPLTAAVDGELVMLDTRQSLYFGLDAIGYRIWALLEQPCSIAALCVALCEEFDVPAETCQADVLAFLEQMEQAELVEIR